MREKSRQGERLWRKKVGVKDETNFEKSRINYLTPWDVERLFQGRGTSWIFQRIFVGNADPPVEGEEEREMRVRRKEERECDESREKSLEIYKSKAGREGSKARLGSNA